MREQNLLTFNLRAWRYLVGGCVMLGGSLLLAQQAWLALQASLPTPIWHALQGGLLCALGTALGALPVLFMRSVSARLMDTLLGFGGGVMLAASVFSLLLPALQAAQQQGLNAWAGGLLVSLGVALGAGGLFWVGQRLARAASVQPARVDLGVLLFVLAIVLHNIPEGMAVGIAAGAQLEEARGLALGMALQDVPEGLVVALALAAAGLSRWHALAFGIASGLVEPVFAVLCAWLVGVATPLLPWGLSLAAGAMLFVVLNEIIPASRARGYEGIAGLGLLLGFCLMMVLDTALV